jgi:hypothetical protein
VAEREVVVRGAKRGLADLSESELLRVSGGRFSRAFGCGTKPLTPRKLSPFAILNEHHHLIDDGNHLINTVCLVSLSTLREPYSADSYAESLGSVAFCWLPHVSEVFSMLHNDK